MGLHVVYRNHVYQYLLPVLQHSLFSYITWSSAKFQLHFFLAAMPPETWYGALATGPTRSLVKSHLQVIYSLLFDLVFFLHIMVKWQIFIANFSATMHHSHFKLGMVLQLQVLHFSYESASYLFPVLQHSLFSHITW